MPLEDLIEAIEIVSELQAEIHDQGSDSVDLYEKLGLD